MEANGETWNRHRSPLKRTKLINLFDEAKYAPAKYTITRVHIKLTGQQNMCYLFHPCWFYTNFTNQNIIFFSSKIWQIPTLQCQKLGIPIRWNQNTFFFLLIYTHTNTPQPHIVDCDEPRGNVCTRIVLKNRTYFLCVFFFHFNMSKNQMSFAFQLHFRINWKIFCQFPPLPPKSS